MTKEELKNFLDRLSFIFYSIVAIPLVSFSYLYLENKVGRLSPKLDDIALSLLQYISPTIVIILCGLAIIIPRNHVRQIDSSKELQRKLIEFRRIMILRYMIFWLASSISVVAFYLSAHQFYSILFILTLILFSLNRPTPQRLISNLRIEGEERELIKKVSSI